MDCPDQGTAFLGRFFLDGLRIGYRLLWWDSEPRTNAASKLNAARESLSFSDPPSFDANGLSNE